MIKMGKKPKDKEALRRRKLERKKAAKKEQKETQSTLEDSSDDEPTQVMHIDDLSGSQEHRAEYHEISPTSNSSGDTGAYNTTAYQEFVAMKEALNGDRNDLEEDRWGDLNKPEPRGMGRSGKHNSTGNEISTTMRPMQVPSEVAEYTARLERERASAQPEEGVIFGLPEDVPAQPKPRFTTTIQPSAVETETGIMFGSEKPAKQNVVTPVEPADSREDTQPISTRHIRDQIPKPREIDEDITTKTEMPKEELPGSMGGSYGHRSKSTYSGGMSKIAIYAAGALTTLALIVGSAHMLSKDYDDSAQDTKAKKQLVQEKDSLDKDKSLDDKLQERDIPEPKFDDKSKDSKKSSYEPTPEPEDKPEPEKKSEVKTYKPAPQQTPTPVPEPKEKTEKTPKPMKDAPRTGCDRLDKIISNTVAGHNKALYRAGERNTDFGAGELAPTGQEVINDYANAAEEVINNTKKLSKKYNSIFTSKKKKKQMVSNIAWRLAIADGVDLDFAAQNRDSQLRSYLKLNLCGDMTSSAQGAQALNDAPVPARTSSDALSPDLNINDAPSIDSFKVADLFREYSPDEHDPTQKYSSLLDQDTLDNLEIDIDVSEFDMPSLELAEEAQITDADIAEAFADYDSAGQAYVSFLEQPEVKTSDTGFDMSEFEQEDQTYVSFLGEEKNDSTAPVVDTSIFDDAPSFEELMSAYDVPDADNTTVYSSGLIEQSKDSSEQVMSELYKSLGISNYVTNSEDDSQEDLNNGNMTEDDIIVDALIELQMRREAREAKQAYSIKDNQVDLDAVDAEWERLAEQVYERAA